MPLIWIRMSGKKLASPPIQIQPLRPDTHMQQLSTSDQFTYSEVDCDY